MPEDPLIGFKFHVEIEGIIEGSFTECSGLNVSRTEGEKIVKEGGGNNYVYRLPGRITYSNITLKRGVTHSNELWKWFQEGIVDGKVKRVNMSVIHLDQAGAEVKRWNLMDAYPVKWTSPDFKADSNQVGIESLEITYNWLEPG